MSTDHTPTVWPTLTYRDAEAAIRFLIDAFGFEESVVFRDEDRGLVAHAEVRWPSGTGGVMLGSAREDSVLADRAPGTGSVYVVCEDADALYERALAAGATVVRELHDEPHGSHDFSVRDPEGVVWSFGTYGGAG